MNCIQILCINLHRKRGLYKFDTFLLFPSMNKFFRLFRWYFKFKLVLSCSIICIIIIIDRLLSISSATHLYSCRQNVYCCAYIKWNIRYSHFIHSHFQIQSYPGHIHTHILNVHLLTNTRVHLFYKVSIICLALRLGIIYWGG